MHAEAARLTAADFGRLAEEVQAAALGLLLRGLAERAGGGQLLLLAQPEEEQPALRLLIVTDPTRSRFHLVPAGRPVVRPPPRSAFARDALPFLRDAVLLSVSVRRGERLLELRFSRSDPHREELLLIGELFGSRPNLLLVDGQGIIRALKHARAGGREARVGIAYTPPPARPAGTGEGLLAALPQGEGPFAREHPLSARLYAHFQPLDEAAARDSAWSELLSRLARELARRRRLLEQLEGQLVDSEQAERLRQLGDLLSAHFHELRPGQDSVQVEDLYQGGTVTIPLDPRLGPRENLETCYRRARKLERTRAAVVERIAAVRQQIEISEKRLSRLEQARREGTAPDAELLGELPGSKVGPDSGRRGKPARKPAGRQRLPAGIHRFVLGSGLVALVGKSNQDNDTLTVRIARGNDLWLHVQDAAGSHVVIRLPPGKTASLEDLIQAGALATHYSKRRGSARADVSYTPRKYVRKSRKTSPGTVTLERFKTLSVSDAETVYEALLRSQPAS